jgi:hypothetical protein
VTTVDSQVELAVTPLTGTTGAEIRGVSLRQPLPLATVAEIRQALFDYKVIFFPEQHLSTDEHFAFAAQLGRSPKVTRRRPRIMAAGGSTRSTTPRFVRTMPAGRIRLGNLGSAAGIPT